MGKERWRERGKGGRERERRRKIYCKLVNFHVKIFHDKYYMLFFIGMPAYNFIACFKYL